MLIARISEDGPDRIDVRLEYLQMQTITIHGEPG
jgi:hypothetical protein